LAFGCKKIVKKIGRTKYQVKAANHATPGQTHLLALPFQLLTKRGLE